MTPEVEIAAIVTGGGVVTAIITGWLGLLTKKTSKRLDQKVGNPNGYGDITTMLEIVLENTKSLGARMDSYERESRIRGITLSRLTKTVRQIEEKLNDQHDHQDQNIA